MAFEATEGETPYIQIGGFDATSGLLKVAVEPPTVDASQPRGGAPWG